MTCQRWTRLLLFVALALPLLGITLPACECGDDDDSTNSGHGQDDDAGDDDASPGDDDASPDDDDDASPDEEFVVTDGDLRRELIDGGSMGATGVDAALGPDGRLYVVSTRSRLLTLYTIDEDGAVRRGLSALAEAPRLAVEAGGVAHLAYLDRPAAKLWLQTNESGAWTRETIAADPGAARPGLTAADGRLHACYSCNSGLCYAVRDAENWTVEEAPSEGGEGDCDLAVAPDGAVSLLYVENGADGEQLALLTKAAKDWTREVVVPAGYFDGAAHTIRSPRIALDDAGGIHAEAVMVAYVTPQKNYLVHAQRVQAKWPLDVFTTQFEPTDGWLGLDGDGEPHMLAGDGIAVAHAFRLGEHWETDLISAPGRAGHVAGAFAADGELWAFFATLDEPALQRATWSTGGWFRTAVEASSMMGERLGLTIGAADDAHVAYSDKQGDRMLWADKTADGWTPGVLSDCGWSGELDDSARLAVAQDADGWLHAAWIHCDPYNVTYARQTADGWEVERASGHYADYGLALAADDEGFAHLVFEDNNELALAYVTNRSGHWVAETLTPPLASAGSPVIAVDADHAAHVAYIQPNAQTWGDLLYATNASGEWKNETVVSGLFTYYLSPAIALDAAGEPALAAAEQTTGGAFRADVFRRKGAGWKKDVAAEAHSQNNFAFGSCSLALDANGAAHLAFCWGCLWYNPPSLVYATDAGGAWTLATIDNFAPDDAITTGLALDHAGNVQISYYMAQGLWRAVFPQGWPGN